MLWGLPRLTSLFRLSEKGRKWGEGGEGRKLEDSVDEAGVVGRSMTSCSWVDELESAGMGGSEGREGGGVERGKGRVRVGEEGRGALTDGWGVEWRGGRGD